MLRIILIRPGSTDFDDEERIQGALDIPLNANGSSQIAQAIDELREQGIETVYAPPCEPAQETGKVIARELDAKLKKLDRMKNLNHGLWQGMLVEDVRRKQPKVYRQWQAKPESVCPPQGETLNQAEDRVRTAMTRVLKRHKEGVIALVVPEPLLSLVRCFINNNNELGDLWKAPNGHERWEIVEVEPEKVLAASE